MNITGTILAVVIGLTLGWVLVKTKNVDYSRIHIIDRAIFIDNMRKGQLIDIRKKDAFEQDKIKGARNFKVSVLTSKYNKLRKDQSIYLYCQNGKKSKKAAKKLSKAEFSNIYVLEGGIDSYNNFN